MVRVSGQSVSNRAIEWISSRQTGTLATRRSLFIVIVVTGQLPIEIKSLTIWLFQADDYRARRGPCLWFGLYDLHYFNVAGADPRGRAGQSTRDATHLIKVAVEAALGLRPKIEIFGSDYPTPDGTCIRDYIHVSDLVQAHLEALRYLRSGGGSLTLNCGYGHGFSVREVLDTVKRVSGVDFRVESVARRSGDPAQTIAETKLVRQLLGWHPKFDNLSTIVAHALAWERTLV
jgi:UDP-glucose 4-epimerase